LLKEICNSRVTSPQLRQFKVVDDLYFASVIPSLVYKPWDTGEPNHKSILPRTHSDPYELILCECGIPEVEKEPGSLSLKLSHKQNQYLSSPVPLYNESYTGVYDPDNPASFENYMKQTRLEVTKLVHSSLQKLKCSLMQIKTTDVLLNTVCNQKKIGLQGLQLPSSMLACKNKQLTPGLIFKTWDIGELFKITPTLIFKPWDTG